MLVNWEGLTPSEAARVLGERPATFRVRLHRARSRFRHAARAVDRGARRSGRPHGPRSEAVKVTREVPDV